MSIVTPARDARYSASITCSSTIEFIFMPDQAAAARPLVLDLPLDPVDDAGADTVRGDQQVGGTRSAGSSRSAR